MRRVGIAGREICESVADGLRRRGFEISFQTGDLNQSKKLAIEVATDAVVMSASVVSQTKSGIGEIVKSLLPKPVILVSVNPSAGIAGAYDGISSGAFGFLESNTIDETLFDSLASKLHLALDGVVPYDKSPLLISAENVQPCAVPIAAIGASTGGPAALSEILSKLPSDFCGACAIVQHLDSEFSDGLAEWLSKRSKIPVEIAVDGGFLMAGKAYISNADGNFTISPTGRFNYERGDGEDSFCPSINRFFESLENFPKKGCAVLLTGMGDDGAEGLLALRKAGWRTIAQDETSSAVYGMPKAAFKIGAASEILGIEKIGGRIASIISSAQSDSRK